MRIRNGVTVVAACLCLAGCFKGGQKAPLVESKGSSRLERIYSKDVNQRLSRVFDELLSLKSEIKKLNKEWREYHQLKEGYIKTKERHCKGTASLDPDILYEELLEWHTQIHKESLALSLKATKLMASVRSEMQTINEAERAVGHPLFDESKKEIAKNIERLSAELKEEIPNVVDDIVAEPPCVSEDTVVAAKGKKEAVPGEDPLGGFPARGEEEKTERSLPVTLEPELTAPKEGDGREDIYSDEEVKKLFKSRR